MSARVIGAVVQVTVGGRVHQVARGADLPAGVAPETVQRLVAKGLIEEYAQPSGYAELTVDELKALIEQRNEGREESEQLPAKGKKSDLIAALEADDEANSQHQQ